MEQRGSWIELGLGSFGLAGLGAIVAAMLNGAHLMPFHIPAWLVAAVFVSFFLSGRLRFRTSIGNLRFRNAYNQILLMVAIIITISIPFLFWGVIKTLIDMATGRGPAL